MLVSPINIYGESKLEGEELAFKNNEQTIVIRTSWVYSEFGNNFVKTMLRLMKERDSINVVNDQYGCPTYAGDLAEAIMIVIEKCSTLAQPPAGNVQSSIFNYANAGITTWFDFAQAIQFLKWSTVISSRSTFLPPNSP